MSDVKFFYFLCYLFNGSKAEDNTVKWLSLEPVVGMFISK